MLCLRLLLIWCLLLTARTGVGQSAAAALARRFPAERYGMWELAEESFSPAARHATYRPVVAGRWLWPGSVRVLEAPGRQPTLRANGLLRLDSLRGISAAAHVDAAWGARLAQQYLAGQVAPADWGGVVVKACEPVWYRAGGAGGGVRAGWLVNWGHAKTAVGAWEVLLDEATGEVVGEPQNLLCYHEAASAGPRDTLAVALVFLPDPLTTARQPYGRPYIDSLDTDRAVLNLQRVADTLHLTFERDSFRLRNPWFEIAEFDPPVRRVVAAPGAGGLQFTRAQPGFQQVNALFHLTRCRQYVSRLGFSGLLHHRVRVDASGLSGADQSRFSPVDTTLSFGEGGVDDAEDADVLTHEYQHALAFGAAPGSNVGLERRTLDEANGDYWAAVHSVRLQGATAYGAEQVFNWDGHNEFWPGRWVISPKMYPHDLLGSMYLDADIWSSTLWQIRRVLPDTIADRLWLQHLYGYAPNLTMPEAAALLLQADTLLYGGAHADTIFHFFDQRHILGQHTVVGVVADEAEPGAALWASDAFARGESARLRLREAADLWLLNATGQVVWRGRAAADRETAVPAGRLAPGLYVLRVGSGGRGYRLLRW